MNPGPISISPPPTRQRLEDAILREIERLGDALNDLGRLDLGVFQAGIAVHKDEAQLALWFVQPYYLLDGRVPLSLLAQEGGRQELLGLFEAWQKGDIFS